MVIGTLDDIPLRHEWFESPVDRHKTSVKQAAAEITKGFIIGVLSGTYDFMRPGTLKTNGILTFGNRQETNQNKSVLVGSPDAVVHIPNREVDRVILMLAGSD